MTTNPEMLWAAGGFVIGIICWWIVMSVWRDIARDKLQARVHELQENSLSLISQSNLWKSEAARYKGQFESEQTKRRKLNNLVTCLQGAFTNGNLLGFCEEWKRQVGQQKFKFEPDDKPSGRRGAHGTGGVDDKGDTIIRRKELG